MVRLVQIACLGTSIVRRIGLAAYLNCISGCNSVWLECVVWDHDAAGSSPVIPTIIIEATIRPLKKWCY